MIIHDVDECYLHIDDGVRSLCELFVLLTDPNPMAVFPRMAEMVAAKGDVMAMVVGEVLSHGEGPHQGCTHQVIDVQFTETD